jgi:uncharacterized protein (TIGR02996 family)
MLRHQELLQKIIAEPHDLDLRHAYADALQADDPDHAAFVAADLALGRLRLVDAPRDDHFWDAFDKRDRALHRARRQVMSAAGAMLVRPWLRNGFVEGGCLTGADFVRQADTLFRAVPLRSLTLTQVRPQLDAILADERLEQLAALDLGSNGLSNKHALAIASSTHLAGLRLLDLSRNRIGRAGVEAIAASPRLASLEVLLLADNPAPPIHCEPMLDSGQVFAFRDVPSFARELSARFGPKPWLGRKDEVPPSPPSV